VSSNEYQFLSRWQVEGTCGEVADVLGDPLALAQWWPSVYLDVEVLDEGGEGNVGAKLDLYTKGWLPYTLRWTLEITEPITDAGYALSAVGDLAGTGRWTFRQDGPEVEIIYDWRISATKPLLRRLSWLLRPAFSANHVWAMRKGEESLRLELRRRRPGSGPVPPPPPATFSRLRWRRRADG